MTVGVVRCEVNNPTLFSVARFGLKSKAILARGTYIKNRESWTYHFFLHNINPPTESQQYEPIRVPLLFYWTLRMFSSQAKRSWIISELNSWWNLPKIMESGGTLRERKSRVNIKFRKSKICLCGDCSFWQDLS